MTKKTRKNSLKKSRQLKTNVKKNLDVVKWHKKFQTSKKLSRKLQTKNTLKCENATEIFSCKFREQVEKLQKTNPCLGIYI